MKKRFACRTCRREVKLDGEGIATHLDSSPACMLTIAEMNMPDYDKHEIVEDESTIAKEPERESSEVGERVSERKDAGKFTRRRGVR